ncbi:ABC transporter substrate-binding protein [Edaphobacillus lindanitolerans]|uniref:Peptide/nickel transport system substrate-binding protein n=1 Tax=Edaphobacillus lindanitolerans TaxID=550447 RepID=A0A1U7PNK4_9BACI|nr:ABC transporter substrate-binding protein [Edaphobacillus lindanitolerans]SIT73315.1 peptide/nickel transport system substrate-binding protein [Edaphobacillus lindanitolerans]
MKKWRINALLVVLLMVVAGCSDKEASTGGTSGSDSNDGTLVIAQASDVTTMDPQNSLSTTGDRVFRNMFSRLFYWDENMELQPEVAESYEQTDDTTWHFKLKEGITFHNGDPLTAEDVKYSLERVMTDDTLKEFPYFKQLKQVNVLDEHNVEIITDGPMPTMLNVLAKSGADIIPKQHIEEVGMDEFIKNPIGSGPYKYVEWVRDDRVVMEPYEDYFNGTPKWKKVTVRAIPESSTRVGELITGGVDVITDVPPNEWARLDSETGVELVKGETTRVNLLMVRTTEGTVTADPKVREAIDLAIDEQAIVDSLFQGNAVPVRTRVPKGVFGANPDLYDTNVYDLDRAKKLLEEAGHPDGVDLTFTASKGRYPLDGEVAELITAMLTEAGFNVNLKLLETSAFIEDYNANKNEELIMIGLADGLLDASYSLVHYTKERAAGQTDYFNEEVENLYKEAGRNLNDGERAKQYERIQEIVAEERPHIFLFQQGANYGIRDNVQFTPNLNEVIFFDDMDKK